MFQRECYNVPNGLSSVSNDPCSTGRSAHKDWAAVAENNGGGHGTERPLNTVWCWVAARIQCISVKKNVHVVEQKAPYHDTIPKWGLNSSGGGQSVPVDVL